MDVKQTYLTVASNGLFFLKPYERKVSISLNAFEDYFRANQRARSVDYEKVFHGKHCGGLNNTVK